MWVRSGLKIIVILSSFVCASQAQSFLGQQQSLKQESPDSPRPIINRKFLLLSSLAVGSTLSDSYTTTWIRPNWQAGRKTCNIEGQSAWLYGSYPTPARAWGVGMGKSALAVSTAYLLKRKHVRWWAAPLLLETGASTIAVGHNLQNCQ